MAIQTVQVSVSSGINDTIVGTQAWVNPANALTDDGTRTTANSPSNLLRLTKGNADIIVSPDSKLLGIAAVTQHRGAAGGAALQIIAANLRTGSAKTFDLTFTSGEVHTNFGGSSDNWGVDDLLVAAGLMNSSAFGIGFWTTTGGIEIDCIPLTVYIAPGNMMMAM